MAKKKKNKFSYKKAFGFAGGAIGGRFISSAAYSPFIPKTSGGIFKSFRASGKASNKFEKSHKKALRDVSIRSGSDSYYDPGASRVSVGHADEGILLHELSHAYSDKKTPGFIKPIKNLAYAHGGKIGNIVGAYFAGKGQKEKALASVAIGRAPQLIEEAQATGHAVKHLIGTYGFKEGLKRSGKLLAANASYFVAAAGELAGAAKAFKYFSGKKKRITSKRKSVKKIEDKAKRAKEILSKGKPSMKKEGGKLLTGKAAKKAYKSGKKGRWVTMRGRKVFIPNG